VLFRSPRTEAFLVPADSQVKEIVTDAKTYREQAEALGYKVYGKPSAFSTGPDIQVPEILKELADPWPPISPAETYRIKAKKEKPSRQGLLTPAIIEWIRNNDGRIPGGGHVVDTSRYHIDEKQDRWDEGLWDKDAGVLVVFPQPTPPWRPKDKKEAEEAKNITIERRSNPPTPWSLPVPPEFIARNKSDERVAPARLRRLVIQEGEPLQLRDSSGNTYDFRRKNLPNNIYTTLKGMEHLKRFLANPPEMPELYETSEKTASLPLSKRIPPISHRVLSLPSL
jgi:hypothetical protein